MSKKDLDPILIAYDFSDTAELALQHGLNLALDGEGRPFHFLVVLDRNRGLGLRPKEKIDAAYAEDIQKIATERIAHAIHTLDRGGEIEMMVHVRLGDPAQQILALAREIGASLIVVGSHGRTGMKRYLLGSVSEQIVREAQCPVTVARKRNYEHVDLPKVVEVDREHDEYIAPHRYHYDTGVPTRNKAWALY